jgi:hypothetical protein
VPHWIGRKNESISSNEITWRTRMHFVVMHSHGSLFTIMVERFTL